MKPVNVRDDVVPGGGHDVDSPRVVTTVRIFSSARAACFDGDAVQHRAARIADYSAERALALAVMGPA